MVQILILFSHESDLVKAEQLFNKLKPYENECAVHTVKTKIEYTCKSEHKIVRLIRFGERSMMGRRADILYVPEDFDVQEYRSLIYPCINSGGTIFTY
jgi:hypothetical protein